MTYFNYLNYTKKILEITKGDKSTNTYRILFALNCYPDGATYTNLLNFAPAFSESALSRSLQTCLSRGFIDYNENTKLYKSNYFYQGASIDMDSYRWLQMLLASSLIGPNTTLIRIAIYLIAVDEIHINDLANEISVPEKYVENAILSLTEGLGTNIIIYDETSLNVAANTDWFSS